jgi:hypothetical protein
VSTDGLTPKGVGVAELSQRLGQEGHDVGLTDAEEIREDLDQERDARHWEIVNGCKLNNREAAERVRERLLAAGLSDEQIRGLGVTEHSIKAVTRLRRKP